MAGAPIIGVQYLERHRRETAIYDDIDQQLQDGSRLREIRAKLRTINEKLAPRNRERDRQPPGPLGDLPREERIHVLRARVKAMKRKLTRSRDATSIQEAQRIEEAPQLEHRNQPHFQGSEGEGTGGEDVARKKGSRKWKRLDRHGERTADAPHET